MEADEPDVQVISYEGESDSIRFGHDNGRPLGFVETVAGHGTQPILSDVCRAMLRILNEELDRVHPCNSVYISGRLDFQFTCPNPVPLGEEEEDVSPRRGTKRRLSQIIEGMSVKDDETPVEEVETPVEDDETPLINLRDRDAKLSECPICHDEMLPGCTTLRGLDCPCTAVFHRDCIVNWQVSSDNKKCPVCQVKTHGFITVEFEGATPYKKSTRVFEREPDREVICIDADTPPRRSFPTGGFAFGTHPRSDAFDLDSTDSRIRDLRAAMTLDLELDLSRLPLVSALVPTPFLREEEEEEEEEEEKKEEEEEEKKEEEEEEEEEKKEEERKKDAPTTRLTRKYRCDGNHIAKSIEGRERLDLVGSRKSSFGLVRGVLNHAQKCHGHHRFLMHRRQDWIRCARCADGRWQVGYGKDPLPVEIYEHMRDRHGLDCYTVLG